MRVESQALQLSVRLSSDRAELRRPRSPGGRSPVGRGRPAAPGCPGRRAGGRPGNRPFRHRHSTSPGHPDVDRDQSAPARVLTPASSRGPPRRTSVIVVVPAGADAGQVVVADDDPPVRLGHRAPPLHSDSTALARRPPSHRHRRCRGLPRTKRGLLQPSALAFREPTAPTERPGRNRPGRASPSRTRAKLLDPRAQPRENSEARRTCPRGGTNAGVERELLRRLQGDDLVAGERPALPLRSGKPYERREVGEGHDVEHHLGGGDRLRRARAGPRQPARPPYRSAWR